jgi:assimilatory nitrate reductase catalytic subunit
VVQDAFNNTSTGKYADVLLPASTWGEKEGVVTNSERRITRVNSAVTPPAQARHDWAIMVDFAQRLERRLGKLSTLFSYTTTEEIFNEHRATTTGRDLDISGLSYAVLNDAGPQQWPFKNGDSAGTARLYEDGVFATADGKAIFSNTSYKPTTDKIDARYPLHLLTGRLRDQWHGMSRTGTVAQLFNHVEEPFIYMNPDDMSRRIIKDGDIVKVSNKRGSLVLPVKASNDIQVTQTYIPMHWGSEFMNGLGVNAMMPADFDKTSKQPELKHAAIKVEKLTLPWRMTIMRSIRDLSSLEKLRGLMKMFDYASCGLFGRQQHGYAGMLIFKAAHSVAPDIALIAEIDAILGMTDDMPLLNYQDEKRGISKRILVESADVAGLDKKVTGVRLIGETLATEWLKEVMSSGEFTTDLRRWALAPLSAPPASQPGRGKIVCNCLDVSENEIIDAVSRGADLITLQNKLKCGTECGSCVPELKKLISIHGKTH